MPITRGSTPATADTDEGAERLRAELSCLLLGGDDEHRRASLTPLEFPD